MKNKPHSENIREMKIVSHLETGSVVSMMKKIESMGLGKHKLTNNSNGLSSVNCGIRADRVHNVQFGRISSDRQMSKIFSAKQVT